MKLYDECFEGAAALLTEYPFRRLSISFPPSWKDVGSNQLLFGSDTAFELGGGSLPAVSSIALTDREDLVPCDEVLLCGPDLSEIGSDSPFARIALIRVSDAAMGDGNKLYNTIRKIEYTRYHVNPEGYMPRISPFSQREGVRVGRKAIGEGLSFARIGELFIEGYKKQPGVEAVKLLFVTQKDFPYDRLSALMERSENITKALDHLMKDLKMDCHSCHLRDVCEEVEQLISKDETE